MSRAISRSIRKLPCAMPTPSSCGASRASRRRCARMAGRCEDATLEEMDQLWDEAKAAETEGDELFRRALEPRRAGEAGEPLALLGRDADAQARLLHRPDPRGRSPRNSRRSSSTERPPVGLERDLDRVARAIEPRSISPSSASKPVAGHRRDEHGTSARVRLASRRAFRASRIEEIGLVPHLEQPIRLAFGVDAKLGEHGVDVVALARRSPTSAMSRTCRIRSACEHLFQRGAEGGDQRGRQIGDEADGVGQHGLGAARQAASRGWSGRAWRTACPRRARRRRSAH